MAIALVTVSASAASIDWGVNLGRGGSLTNSNGDSFTGNIYLVLSDTVLDTSTTEAFEASLAAATLDTIAVAAGLPEATAQTATSSLINNGEEYSFSVVVYDVANNAMYVGANPNSAVAYQPGVTDPNSRLVFDAAMLAAPSQWTPTSTAVPEPASAMLALAGVAMLIRRRK